MGRGADIAKWGCFGCAGVLVVLVLVGAAFTLVGWNAARSSAPEQVTLEGPLPPPAGTSTPPSAAGETGVAPPAGSTVDAGQVVIDLSGAEIEIAPGPPGEPVRVEATYDRDGFALEEKRDLDADPWSYEVRLSPTRIGLVDVISRLFGSTSPKVRILLPPDRPMRLVLRVRDSGGEIELGGLWLTEADVDLSRSGVKLNIGEPLARPMERMALRVSMAGGELSNLGNASPRRLDVDVSMSGCELGLRGAWQNDSDVTIHARMGGVQIRLPRNVDVEGVPGGGVGSSSPEPEIGRPTLRFDVDAGEDQVQFSR